jgi:VCBS repeat-containing protein
LSGIALDAFSSDVTDYSVSVAHSVAETTVSATVADSGASLSIDPATDADSEADGHQVALAAGATTVITLTVTAADGSVQATTVRVSRAASNDARLGTLELSGITLDGFSGEVTDYSVSVAHSVAETTVSALAVDAGASVSIDPATDADPDAEGHQVALSAGATTVITITVTAADGSVQATTVRVTRAASNDARLGTLQLSGIALDAFSSDVTDYSVAVAHSVAETTVSATVADAGASLSIDPATDADPDAEARPTATRWPWRQAQPPSSPSRATRSPCRRVQPP